MLGVVILSPVNVPKIADFAGSCFMIPLTMICPVVLKHTWRQWPLSHKIWDVCIIITGILFTVWGLYDFFMI